MIIYHLEHSHKRCAKHHFSNFLPINNHLATQWSKDQSPCVHDWILWFNSLKCQKSRCDSKTNSPSLVISFMKYSQFGFAQEPASQCRFYSMSPWLLFSLPTSQHSPTSLFINTFPRGQVRYKKRCNSNQSVLLLISNSVEREWKWEKKRTKKLGGIRSWN